jgi:hypothetical protein
MTSSGLYLPSTIVHSGALFILDILEREEHAQGSREEEKKKKKMLLQDVY